MYFVLEVNLLIDEPGEICYRPMDFPSAKFFSYFSCIVLVSWFTLFMLWFTVSIPIRFLQQAVLLGNKEIKNGKKNSSLLPAV